MRKELSHIHSENGRLALQSSAYMQVSGYFEKKT